MNGIENPDHFRAFDCLVFDPTTGQVYLTEVKTSKSKEGLMKRLVKETDIGTADIDNVVFQITAKTV